MLLDFGADINKKGGFCDQTPLHMAVHNEYGDPETVELLINRGAEINATSSHPFHGWTPYDFAKHVEKFGRRARRGHRHSETLSLLRKHGGLSREEAAKKKREEENVARAAIADTGEALKGKSDFKLSGSDPLTSADQTVWNHLHHFFSSRAGEEVGALVRLHRDLRAR